MNICIHGNTPYAWAAAIQMAALGNQVTLCPSWSLVIDTPDDELMREPGLSKLLLDQTRTGRLVFSAGQDFTLVERATPDQYWLAHDASLQRLLKESDALLTAAFVRADRDTLPTFVVMTPYPVGSMARLQTYLTDVAAYLREQAIADKRPLPASAPVTCALPLFVRAGSIMNDFLKPALLLIGCDDTVEGAKLRETLRPIARRANHVMIVPLAAAELIKSAVNAMLATRMSFMNEMSVLCESLGIDVAVVASGMAADPRIGSDYLQPGCGFGGPSFSNELISFARTMKDTLDRQSLIETSISVNERQREVLFRKLWRYFKGDLQGRTFAIWGAAYKPGSASVQFSAVHPLLQALWAQGASTRVYDPLAAQSLLETYPHQGLLQVVDEPYAAIQTGTHEAADALVLVTACDEFQCPDFDRLLAGLKQPLIVDGRNVYDPGVLAEKGFCYVGIGRGEVI